MSESVPTQFSPPTGTTHSLLSVHICIHGSWEIPDRQKYPISIALHSTSTSTGDTSSRGHYQEYIFRVLSPLDMHPCATQPSQAWRIPFPCNWRTYLSLPTRLGQEEKWRIYRAFITPIPGPPRVSRLPFSWTLIPTCLIFDV